MSIFGEDITDDILNNGISEDLFPSDNEHNGDNDNNGDDENKNPIKIEPKKRTVRNPRQRLTLEILKGSRGIHTIENYFQDVKFQGKGHEKKDLDEIMLRLQHWAHRMYPNYKFEDILTNIERIGKKKALQVHMSRYRLGMLESNALNAEELCDDGDEDDQTDEPFDEFDALLGEQIAISKLAPKTPNHNRTAFSLGSSISTFTNGNAVMSTPYAGERLHDLDSSVLALPLPPSQPSTPIQSKLSAEQMGKIAENRRLAQERLKLKRETMGQI